MGQCSVIEESCTHPPTNIHDRRFFSILKVVGRFSLDQGDSEIVPPLLFTCFLPFLYVSCSSCLFISFSLSEFGFLFLSVSPPFLSQFSPLFLFLPPDRSENDGRLAPRVKGKASGRLHGGGRSTRHTIRNDSLLRT